MEWLTNERISILELAVTIFVPVFTFFMGRYTSYRSDCRKGMKELNSRFYQPFVTLYHNTRHAYAMNFVDLPLNVQAELVTLLLSNYECFSPFFKKKIDDLDQAFSGYSEELANGEKLLPDEEEFVEKVFESILASVTKQYKKNCRKLYCSIPKRIWYSVAETIIRMSYCRFWFRRK